MLAVVALLLGSEESRAPYGALGVLACGAGILAALEGFSLRSTRSLLDSPCPAHFPNSPDNSPQTRHTPRPPPDNSAAVSDQIPPVPPYPTSSIRRFSPDRSDRARLCTCFRIRSERIPGPRVAVNQRSRAIEDPPRHRRGDVPGGTVHWQTRSRDTFSRILHRLRRRACACNPAFVTCLTVPATHR